MEERLVSYITSKISVTETELCTILSYFKPIQLKKNEMLLTNGQSSQRTFFVTSGCLRIFFINEDGQDSTRYFAFENQFATALVSFITSEPSEEFIQAVEDTEVYYISHSNFYHLLDIIPQWEKFYRIYLEIAYVTNTKRLMSFLVQDALEKYRQLLSENPVIVRRLSNKMVASYLNISQETLSRLKSKL
ncbi:Crp/Fnr family transcriptional regulator [Chryseobacterium indologenes]|uniref:Crp/Fnr family transcriptional regulator n=1 Tax=Chryseobacterium indologenes TaxID=253 RepID=A0A5R9PV83_CHRID|nr:MULTISPECIES: Crp/Fnr family transcriptional regulator [Chryseobacterium]ASE61187.1 Crp/Fnr family transcriptional regulator [Chryseobacterium indologenes]ATN05272.1 Crp/Fnr family transcriptional regulator [Chryseobacterium indologenes]AYY85972.1 Crp/Fnr family transcriptional regulator [Chryseobacterium indologenes]AZB16856.1 Crp/Fnr family transcriptional regulator [Chryseobacterium indologenes]QIX82877.1 Crp/Fnr family transcriptional regulator [Chryseobacterium indologenes]